MAEPTKEQIEQEQKRLDLLQKQNEAVNNLTTAYNALGKIKGKLSDTDKEAINLAKMLTNTSKEIEKSISKRLTGAISSKELEKQLKQLKQDQIYDLYNQHLLL
jgi:flagellar capping protein FliD